MIHSIKHIFEGCRIFHTEFAYFPQAGCEELILTCALLVWFVGLIFAEEEAAAHGARDAFRSGAPDCSQNPQLNRE